jgi:hypothetical protein
MDSILTPFLWSMNHDTNIDIQIVDLGSPIFVGHLLPALNLSLNSDIFFVSLNWGSLVRLRWTIDIATTVVC